MHSAAVPPAGFALVYFPQNESGGFQVLLPAHPLPDHVIAISGSSAELMIKAELCLYIPGSISPHGEAALLRKGCVESRSQVGLGAGGFALCFPISGCLKDCFPFGWDCSLALRQSHCPQALLVC